jgi:UDPglucose--hexose-1-phosphate uridylyltransferase
MPELRKDPVIGRWVIISSERKKRPMDTGVPKEIKPVEGKMCPFDPGNEGLTPKEIMAYRKDGSAPNTKGWEVRVVPNKFPALMIEGELTREGDGIYDRLTGIGAHEVIIETPNHHFTFSDLTEAQKEDVFWAYRDRMVDLKKDHRFRYVLIFKNHGESAGASLEHSHSQLIALPIIPRNVVEEMDGAKQYYGYKERCIFCDIVKQELQQKIRVVCETGGFIAIEPFAPRFPFETWILPKTHDSHFEDAQKNEVVDLARIFHEVFKRIDKVLNKPHYNWILHSSPFNGDGGHFFHWHFEIMPRLTYVAGFERGSGFYINPTPPEEAAQYLREAEI